MLISAGSGRRLPGLGGQRLIVAAWTRLSAVCLPGRCCHCASCPTLGAAHLCFLFPLGRRGLRQTSVSRAKSEGLGQEEGEGFPSCAGGRLRSPSQAGVSAWRGVLCSRAGPKPLVTALHLLVTRTSVGRGLGPRGHRRRMPALREPHPVKTLCKNAFSYIFCTK